MNELFLPLVNSKSKIAAFAAIELLFILQGVFCFKAISGSKTVVVFTIVSMLLVGLLFFLLFRKEGEAKRHFDKLFLSALLVLGSFYMVIFPPNSVPDEIFHFQASYKYSDVVLGEEVDGRVITIRNEDRPLFEDGRIKVSATHYGEVIDELSLLETEEGSYSAEVLSTFDLAANPPQVKFASVAGITLGRLLGLGAYPVYYLGRLFSFLWFAFLAFLAVRVTPFGKSIFMAVSLLPMTLHLTGSYSYDSAIIGMSLLLSALCLKAVFEKGRISKKLLVAIGILVFLMAPCKVIYTSVALLVLFIPQNRFSSRRECLMIKMGILLLAVLSVVSLRASTLIAMASSSASTIPGNAGPTLDVRGSETGVFYGLSDVLADPLGIAWMYLSTLGHMGAWYVETAVGGSLGWFQEEIIANDMIVFSLIAVLLLSSLKSEDVSEDIPPALRVGLLAIVLMVCAMAGASMLLAHTFVGEPFIMGIQGRYVLPVAVLLLLALQTKKITYNGNQATLVLMAMLSINLLYLINIYAIALTL